MTYIIQKILHSVTEHLLTTVVVAVLSEHKLHQTVVSFVFLLMKLNMLMMEHLLITIIQIQLRLEHVLDAVLIKADYTIQVV